MKLIDATILENTSTHLIVELTVKTFTIFKSKEEKVKVYKEKQSSFWDAFDKRYIDYDVSKSLNAFVSTGKNTITF